MPRIIAIISGFALAGFIVLYLAIGPDRSGPSVDPMPLNLAPDTRNNNSIDARTTRKNTKIRTEIAKRFPDAPAKIQDIAASIANPDTPFSNYEHKIRALDPEEINAEYGRPFPERFEEYGHTLMREAVMSRNTAASALLAALGADLSYNDNEMAFQALKLDPVQHRWRLVFPDRQPGNKILGLWLRQADKVEITHPLYDQGTLLLNAETNNLLGILLLLEAGADPWAPFDITTQDGDFLYEIKPFLLQLAGRDPIANEVAFRIALMGHYDTPPARERARLIAAYRQAAIGFPDTETPEILARKWALQKTIRMVFDAIDEVPGQPLRDFLIEGVPQKIGGFYLGSNEFHSPPVPSQRKSLDNLWGPEKWYGIPGKKDN